MSDNYVANSGSGGSTFGSDDISSVQYPRIKLIHGADGTNDGDVSSANPLPVNATGSVAHDSADAGNPVKIGGKAISAFPTAVTANDRSNIYTNLYGQVLVGHIDPAMQTWKTVNVTTTQTGSDVWSPTAGKRIAVTSLSVSAYGTTGGRVILWFGLTADTTYSAGTDQALFICNVIPSASLKENFVFTPAVPVFCTTADMEIHLTTDANISLDIVVYGYEW